MMSNKLNLVLFSVASPGNTKFPYVSTLGTKFN